MRKGLIILLGSGLFAAPAAAAGYQRTIAAGEVQNLTIAVLHGDVRVTGSKERKIRIDADADPGVKVDGRNVTIGSFDAENPPKNPEEVDEWQGKASEIEVTLPLDVALTVRTLAGDVTVKGIAGRTHLTVISGDVRVSDCVGPLEIEAVSGDIDIRGLAADLNAKSVSGEVTVRGFDALTLEAKSVSGTVTVRDSKARTVRIVSHSGDLIYAGTTPVDGSVELTTFSGNAVVEIPPKTGFEVDATTFSGDVTIGPETETTEHSSHRTRARTRDRGPRLRLKSHSGNVHVR